jgi:hypothetical protein
MNEMTLGRAVANQGFRKLPSSRTIMPPRSSCFSLAIIVRTRTGMSIATGWTVRERNRVMDRDQAQTLQRDALQYTKNYGLFVLRTCILLNGGAIIALLTAVTHQSDSIVIALATVRFSIVLLVFGLVCAVIAAVFGYLNFERGQSTLSDAKMKRYRNIALACAALSLAFFCAASIIAVFSVNEAPISEIDGQTER